MTIKQSFSPRDDDIDLHAIFGTLLDNKRLLIVATGVFLLLSVIYAVLATPIYQASAMLQIEQKVPSLPGLDDLNQTLGVSTSQAVTEIALLTSRMVVGQAVNDLKLDTESAPEHFPVFGAFMARRFKPAASGAVAPALGGMNRYDWGGAKLDIARLDVPPTLLEQQLYLIAGRDGAYTLQDEDGSTLLTGRTGDAASGQGITLQVNALQANPGTRFDVMEHAHLATIAVLQKQLDAEEQGKDSGIVQLTYRNTDPVLATKLLAQISTLYVRQNVDRSSAEAANSLKFVRQQLPNVRLQLEQATQAMNAFQRGAHSVDISMQTKALLDQIVAIETSQQQLHMQMSDLQQHFTPEHPAYKALAQQIGQLEAKRGTLDKKIGLNRPGFRGGCLV